jgi:hypothetical protein
MGGAGVGDRGRGYFVRMPNSLDGCDRWGEGRGIINIKASVVQCKNIRPRPLAARVRA